MSEHREQVSADAAEGQWVLPGYYWAGWNLDSPPSLLGICGEGLLVIAVWV